MTCIQHYNNTYIHVGASVLARDMPSSFCRSENSTVTRVCRHGGVSSGGVLVGSRNSEEGCQELKASEHGQQGVMCPQKSLMARATGMLLGMRLALKCAGWPVMMTSSPSSGYLAVYSMLHVCSHIR